MVSLSSGRVARPSLIAALLCAALVSSVAEAEPRLDPSESSPAAYRQHLNDMVVTIMAGGPQATGLDIAYDLAGVLDDDVSLRIVPIIGKGVAQNVRDVRFMRGVDLGLTHANILNHFARTGELGSNLVSQITYVAKLFNEEVHLITRSDVDGIQDLAGKRVNLGGQGSGSNITAKLLLDSLEIRVHPTYLNTAEAIRELKSGELDATFVIGGKPTPILSAIREEDGLKLLSIPYKTQLEDDYYPATLTAHDYPGLVSQGDTLETVAVCAVLITFNWSKDSERYRKIEKFIDAFFSKFESFHKPPNHPKWREVNFAATLENWNRSPIAQDWINRSNMPTSSKAEFDEFVQERMTSSQSQMSEFERTQLFREFVEWNNDRQGVAGE